MNKRKRADKTSGRKHPRIDDVDVVGAGDSNMDEINALQVVVQGGGDDDFHDVEPMNTDCQERQVFKIFRMLPLLNGYAV